MPVMQIFHPQRALDDGRKALLASRLTDVLLTMEGGAKTEGGLAFATVVFTPVVDGDWWVGGRTDAHYVAPPGRFIVRVSIPEGYMNQAHKTDVHRGVADAILDVMGRSDDPKLGANILVTIEEITEGNWGAAGRTISLASIADSVGLPKTGERFRWVLSYFAAKARQYRAAGYPSDAGGLLPESPAGSKAAEVR